MTTIELIILKYALAPIAALGCIAAFFGLRIAREDLRLLDSGQINGGKRFTTITRITQAAFLLAAFGIFLVVGVVFWVSAVQPREFYELPQVMAERIGLNVAALLLLAKEWSVRRTRVKLDEYYDAQRRAEHGHRRSTDPPDLNQKHLREGNGN